MYLLNECANFDLASHCVQFFVTFASHSGTDWSKSSGILDLDLTAVPVHLGVFGLINPLTSSHIQIHTASK